jgi:DNA-directed RNA polymerase specialized sigma subunit
MAKFQKDEAFIIFTDSLTKLITGYGPKVTGDALTKAQKIQVESLIKAEVVFRKRLQKDSRGKNVYKKFVSYILDERHNILAARPYFRERQDVFANEISPAIKRRKFKKLYKFDINFPFVQFVLDCVKWGPNSKIIKGANDIQVLRKKLIELNLPLAISRARIFRQKTQESHLSYMDLVQIAGEGLINAVDKFVLPYTPVFRSVILGRITGDHIEENNQTLLHFYPSDKRKIYRANKFRRFQKEVDFDDLANRVNEGPKLESPTSPDEIHQLTTASSHISLDSTLQDVNSNNDNDDSLLDLYVAPDDTRPDQRVENAQLSSMLYLAMGCLFPLEIKYLRLKGIPYA